MNQEEFNVELRTEVGEFMCANRGESSAFLIWYLCNFFRIEKQNAIDCVCDSINDKGIDGIYVDEDEEEIYLFQSKYSPLDNKAQGDNDLRNFIGAQQWFKDEASVNQIVSSTASEELKALVRRLDVAEKVNFGFTVYSKFITNKIFDTNALEFIQ